MSSSTKPRPSESGHDEKEEKSDKSKPVFAREMWTGTAKISVAVFDRMIENDGKDFRVFNILVKRSWKEDNEYKSGNSFRPEDICPLALFLQEAYSFIATEQAKR